MILTGGLAKSGDFFFFEQWKRKGSDAVEILQNFIDHMRRYKCSNGYIEKNRFESLMRTCRKLVDAGFYGDPYDIGKLIRKIHLVPHYAVSKLTRIKDNVAPMHRAHKLWFRQDWNNFRDFFVSYPAVDHDEEGDVLEMAVTKSRPPDSDVLEHMTDASGWGSRNTTVTGGVNAYFAHKKTNIWTGHAN